MRVGASPTARHSHRATAVRDGAQAVDPAVAQAPATEATEATASIPAIATSAENAKPHRTRAR